ncbi:MULTISPECIES: hypothetical protein [unclassified Ruminococcus]|uniref:hypothetical protein n=1 Tax=unclassified Ruminococcus TaxID=2608920 RepID=UPI000931A31A|nr:MULTISPECIES: hypothetical protein [unclassified Ruminococcus]
MNTVRVLFTEARRDHGPEGEVGRRTAVRSIILKNGRLALIHSLAYGYYCFPDGGAARGGSCRCLSRKQENFMRVF